MVAFRGFRPRRARPSTGRWVLPSTSLRGLPLSSSDLHPRRVQQPASSRALRAREGLGVSLELQACELSALIGSTAQATPPRGSAEAALPPTGAALPPPLPDRPAPLGQSEGAARGSAAAAAASCSCRRLPLLPSCSSCWLRTPRRVSSGAPSPGCFFLLFFPLPEEGNPSPLPFLVVAEEFALFP